MIKYLLFATLLSSQAFAGHGGVIGEGGGHGVLCVQDPFRSTTTYSMELLDLFESRQINKRPHTKGNLYIDQYDWTVPDSACRILNERKSAVIKAFGKNHFSLPFFDRACELSKQVELVDQVTDTNDFGALAVRLPQPCSLLQIANFVRYSDGTHVVQIQKQNAQYLRSDDVAALLLHESLHEFFKDNDTLSIRQFVGSVFELPPTEP